MPVSIHDRDVNIMSWLPSNRSTGRGHNKTMINTEDLDKNEQNEWENVMEV